MRPPKLAIKTVMLGLIAVAILALGAVSASAAPNPGYGAPGVTIVGATGLVGPIINPSPTYVTPHEPKEDGPQTANVPTLAWVGEEVKLVACDDNILALPFDGLYETAVFSIENWTGDQAFQSTPTFNGSDASNIYINNQGSSSFFFPTGSAAHYKNCVSADVKSLHAGLSTIKLDVAAQCIGDVHAGPDGNGGRQEDPCNGLSTVQVYSEQFIVIWMTANQPTLSEASVASLGLPGSPGTDAPPLTEQLSTTGVTNATAFLGDPTGNGIFAADLWNKDTPWDQCAGTNNPPSNECVCIKGDTSNGSQGDNCDPSNDTPWTNNGLVQIKVTGSFPVEDAPPSTTNQQYFASLTGGSNPGTITLPRQWAALAQLMATSSTSNTGVRPDLWDIHGGPTNALTHVPQYLTTCPKDGTVFTSAFDAVDDCATLDGINGNPYSFSRLFGDFTTHNTRGPYDAQDPNVTLLSDGHLNSDDAPMPALPITLSIAPNAVNAANAPGLTPDPSPLGGVGGLFGVEKWLVYSHDFNLAPGSGTPGNGLPMALTSTGQGNLYNPFYQEYIPSTTRPINEASGVDGVYDHGFPGSSGDDFPGFSNGRTAPYTFWTELDNSTSDTGLPTGCLRRDSSDVNDPNGYDPLDGPMPVYNQPDYPTSGTVYTDERGEAYVDYNPGNGFFLDSLIKTASNPNGVIPIDTNGACDLQSLLGKEIGQSLISAQVEYPYQAVPYFAPKSSNSLLKVVNSEWSKTLISYPKGNISGVPVSIFVATATDINGQPFQHEEVCFSVQGTGNPGVSVFQGIVPPTGGAPGADTIGAGPTTPPVGTSGYTCAYTNDSGQAAIEVAGSDPGVDVTAWFVDEHIFRDVTTTLGDPTPVTSSTPPTVLPADPVILHAGNAGGAGGSSNSSGGGSTTVVTPPASSVGPANSCKVNSVHLYAKKGYVALKVSCTQSKTDSVVVRTYRSNGKLMHSYRKTIAAGKTVRLRLSTRRVAHVTVSA